MKTFCVLFVTYSIVTLDLIVPVYLQSVQSRHYRPLPDKCDRHGRCSPKEEVDQEDGYKSEKDRSPILTRDDWPIRPMSDDDYDRKKDADRLDDTKPAIGRPGGGGGYRGNYNPKPATDDEKISDGKPGSGYDLKPFVDRDDDIKSGGRPSGGGGGYGGGSYIPKPVVNRDDDDLKPPISRPGGGGSGYGGSGYKPKPAVDEDDDDLKPPISRPGVSGGGYGGGGYKPKPAVDRDDDDLKPPISRPGVSGNGNGGGGYKPKPAVDRDEDDLKPPISRPVVSGSGYGGGGYKPKPAVDRDDDDIKPPISRPGVSGSGYGGGSYKPKPAVDRDDDDDLKPPISRPAVSGGSYGGGGYKPKPAVDRDEEDDDRKPPISRPASGGNYGDGGYKSKPAVDRDDDEIKPPISRPGVSGGGYAGGGYKPKPTVDRDDDDLKPTVSRPAVGGGGYSGGGYKPKPTVDRDDDIKPDVSRPGSGGGGYGGSYDTKPGGNRGGGGYISKTDDDEYIIRGGGGYYPDDDRKSDRPDLGGYNGPKDDDYNDSGIKSEVKDDEYDRKSIPVIDGNCICVPYYQCKDGHIVTDGAGIIDARKRPEPEDELPLDGKFKPPSCGPYHVCCNTPESSTVKPYEHRCGVRNPSGINSRILSPSNKGEADFGEWPWQAAVLKSEGKVNIFQCGGVLIDKYHVLTVAHCVFHLYQLNEYPLKVRLGEWDTQTTTEFLAHEDYKVTKIIIHPEFRNTSLWNDVAVLRLQDPVLFAPHIDTVCLPQYDEVFSGQNCVVTGWGKDAYKGGTFSNVMKEVALQVIDNYKCEEMLRKTRLGRFFQLYEGFLCAGGEYGLDSCKGDGGGPLVCYRKDKSYALAGIVSWGIDCGQPGVPGVYLKIQKYLDWISKTTGVTLQDYWPKH